MLEIFACIRVTFVYFTDQNQISKTVYCVRYLMVSKLVLQTETQKLHFRVRPWFNVSSPTSRRDN